MGDQGFRLKYGNRVEPPAEDMEGRGIEAIGVTAVELTFTQTPIRTIIISSSSTNTGIIYIGKSDIETDGSNAMFMIYPGKTVSFRYNDVSNAMYAVASIDGQTITTGALLRKFDYDLWLLFFDMFLLAVEGAETQTDQVSNTAMVDVSADPISHINSIGELVTTADAVPWVDNRYGFMFCGAKENYILQSEDFGTTWVNSTTLTINSIIAPDGENTADKIAQMSDPSDRVVQTITMPPGSKNTISIFIKNETSTETRIRLYDNNAAAQLSELRIAWTGLIPSTQSSSAVSDIKYTAFNENWYRVSFSVITAATVTVHEISIYPESGETEANGMYAWGIMGVQGEDISPVYIKTTTTTATVATRAGTSSQPISDQMGWALQGISSTNPILVSGDLVAANIYEVVTTEDDTFGVGVVVGDRVTGLTTTLDANNTVQLVSPAAAKIQTAITFLGAIPSTGNHYFFKTGDAKGLRYNADSGEVEFTDGTNTVAVALTAAVTVSYPVLFVYDGANMQLTVNGVTSAQVACEESIMDIDWESIGLGDPDSIFMGAVGPKVTISPFSGAFRLAT